jgi:DNA-binding XRE family transcriptional regulator
MGVIEKIIVSDQTMRQLEQDAKLRGLTLAEEVARRVEVAPAPRPSREELLARMQALRDSLPPQKTDSLTLLREDRDGNRY